MAILDGINRLNPDTLSVLQRLIQDREVDLPDGTKFIAQDKLVASSQAVLPIHRGFRIVALAESNAEAKTPSWLTSETMSLFPFHTIPILTRQELQAIRDTLFPDLPSETTKYFSYILAASIKCCRVLLSFWEKVQLEPDLSLSLRQILRLCRRLIAFSDHSSNDVIISFLHLCCYEYYLYFYT
jgi:hypothetical protein